MWDIRKRSDLQCVKLVYWWGLPLRLDTYICRKWIENLETLHTQRLAVYNSCLENPTIFFQLLIVIQRNYLPSRIYLCFFRLFNKSTSKVKCKLVWSAPIMDLRMQKNPKGPRLLLYDLQGMEKTSKKVTRRRVSLKNGVPRICYQRFAVIGSYF